MGAPIHSFELNDPRRQRWDVVIIGTGAGGAAAGYRLAQRGRSVIFLERGRLHGWPGSERAPLRGRNIALETSPPGHWPEPIVDCSVDRVGTTPVTMGCGAGGTSALYSMLLERFKPTDFTPRRFAGASAECTLPEEWPIPHGSLLAYYIQAEQLFRVRGTADPLDSRNSTAHLLAPSAPSIDESILLETLQTSGLHPYRMHSACERIPDCSGCLGILCSKECRNDAGRICLQPAVRTHGAQVLSECHALVLHENARNVQSVGCEWKGEQIDIHGRVFILAANAFATPRLLFRSANQRFPDGLANSSGLVGRNLMLHVSDWFELRTKRPVRSKGLRHGISLSDFYTEGTDKLGSVHAHALPSEACLFVTVLEDFPYHENRVLPGTSARIEYRYRVSGELRRRAGLLLQEIKRRTHPAFEMRLLAAPGSLNGSHACGTCRFGSDPRTSVLDANNRAHDLDNLYITDASFFPSSSGTTPCLTIVANALRVAERIAETL